MWGGAAERGAERARSDRRGLRGGGTARRPAGAGGLGAGRGWQGAAGSGGVIARRGGKGLPHGGALAAFPRGGARVQAPSPRWEGAVRSSVPELRSQRRARVYSAWNSVGKEGLCGKGEALWEVGRLCGKGGGSGSAPALSTAPCFGCRPCVCWRVSGSDPGGAVTVPGAGEASSVPGTPVIF